MKATQFLQAPLAVLLAVCLLAACASPTSTKPSGYPAPADDKADAYPAPGDQPAFSAPISPYPAPGKTLLSGFEPAPGDEKLNRGNAFPDLESSQILKAEMTPVQATLFLKGDLPTPCNKLRVIVKRDDTQLRVDVEAYSVTKAGEVCNTVIQPFEAKIPLGGFSGGKYTVYVNGEKMGEIDS